MRLDSLGRPPLVQAESAERMKVIPLKTEKTAEVAQPRDPGPSPGDRDGARLGKILEIIESAQERKKRKHQQKKVSEAIKAYQRVHLVESVEPSGQRLNVKA
jgi:hypothetical protein